MIWKMGIVYSLRVDILRLREVWGLSQGLRTYDLQRRGVDPDVSDIGGFTDTWSPSHFMYSEKKNQRSKWNCVMSWDPFYLLSSMVMNYQV